MDNKFLTMKEVIAYLRSSESTIKRMIDDGRLKSYKMGREWRFKKEDLDALTGVIVEKSEEALRADKSEELLRAEEAERKLAEFRAGKTPKELAEWEQELAEEEQKVAIKAQEVQVATQKKEAELNQKEAFLVDSAKKLLAHEKLVQEKAETAQKILDAQALELKIEISQKTGYQNITKVLDEYWFIIKEMGRAGRELGDDKLIEASGYYNECFDGYVSRYNKGKNNDGDNGSICRSIMSDCNGGMMELAEGYGGKRGNSKAYLVFVGEDGICDMIVKIEELLGIPEQKMLAEQKRLEIKYAGRKDIIVENGEARLNKEYLAELYAGKQ